MPSDKLWSYMGFAAKAGALQTGYNTSLSLIARRKVKLLIVAEDASDNTKKKMTQKCAGRNVECRVFGTKEKLSHATGNGENSVFALTDRNFARIVKNEIDRIRSEREVFL